MFVTPALAQFSGGLPFGGEIATQLVPFALIFVIMYVLLIRPQQKRAKEHKALIAGVRRGDVVVTAGGFIAKVTRVVDEAEVEVELSEGVRARLVRGTIQDVRTRGEPVKDAPAATAATRPAKGTGGAGGNPQRGSSR